MDKEVAQELLTWLKDGREFVLEQAPDIAQQILHWGYVDAAFGICIAFILLSITAGLYVIGKQKYATHNFKDESAGDLCWVFGLISGIIGSILFMGNVYQAFFVYNAPKLYLLRQLGKMVK